MKTVNLEPSLQSYKNILKALKEGVKNPNKEVVREIERLEKYIKQEETINDTIT